MPFEPAGVALALIVAVGRSKDHAELGYGMRPIVREDRSHQGDYANILSGCGGRDRETGSTPVAARPVRLVELRFPVTSQALDCNFGKIGQPRRKTDRPSVGILCGSCCGLVPAFNARDDKLSAVCPDVREFQSGQLNRAIIGRRGRDGEHRQDCGGECHTGCLAAYPGFSHTPLIPAFAGMSGATGIKGRSAATPKPPARTPPPSTPRSRRWPASSATPPASA